MQIRHAFFVMLLISFLLPACSGKKKVSNAVTVKFKNIDTSPALLADASEQFVGAVNGAMASLPYESQRSFTPVSFKFPIKRIAMSGTGMDYATVYECPGTTSAECYVDLADKAAVAALVSAPITVKYEEGKSPQVTQFQVMVDPSCDSGSMEPFDVMVKGTFSVNGTTFYTSSTDPSGEPVTSDSSHYSAVGIPMTTCTMTWNLATPAPASAAGVVVSLFVSIKDIAFGNSAAASNSSMCAAGSTGSAAVCLQGYAVPFPYVGDADPQLESFKITEVATGYLGMVHTATYEGKPVGAFQRGYYDGTNVSISNCSDASWLGAINDNGDGSYQMTVDLGDRNYALFDAFKFESHSGKCGNREGTKFDYTATKL